MRLDVSMLDELVCEYCVYRGIVDSGLASIPGKTQNFSAFFFFLFLNSEFVIPCLEILVVSHQRFMMLSASEMQATLEPKVNQLEPGCSSSRNCSLEVDSGANKHSDGETSINNTRMDGSPENNADVSSMQGMDVELRYACEPASNHEDCSTSGLDVTKSPRVLQRHRTHGSGDRGKRKR